jgi:hypothetical protein
MCTLLVGKHQGRRLLDRHRQRWKNVTVMSIFKEKYIKL